MILKSDSFLSSETFPMFPTSLKGPGSRMRTYYDSLVFDSLGFDDDDDDDEDDDDDDDEDDDEDDGCSSQEK